MSKMSTRSRIFFWDDQKSISGVIEYRGDQAKHVSRLKQVIARLVKDHAFRSRYLIQLRFPVEREYSQARPEDSLERLTPQAARRSGARDRRTEAGLAPVGDASLRSLDTRASFGWAGQQPSPERLFLDAAAPPKRPSRAGGLLLAAQSARRTSDPSRIRTYERLPAQCRGANGQWSHQPKPAGPSGISSGARGGIDSFG